MNPPSTLPANNPKESPVVPHIPIYELHPLYLNIIIYCQEVRGYTPNQIAEQFLPRLYKDGQSFDKIRAIDELSMLNDPNIGHFALKKQNKECYAFLKQHPRDSGRYIPELGGKHHNVGRGMQAALDEVRLTEVEPLHMEVLTYFDWTGKNETPLI
ncbi:MAG: hypothetical protein Q9218_002568 [Villophora microphyllina]